MDPCEAISYGDVVQLQYFECVFGNVVNVILGFAGIVLFIMLILGDPDLRGWRNGVCCSCLSDTQIY